MAIDMAIVEDTMTALVVATSKFIFYVTHRKLYDKARESCKVNKTTTKKKFHLYVQK